MGAELAVLGTSQTIEGFLCEETIARKLAEAEMQAADPNVRLLSHDEVFAALRKKHGYEV